MNREIDFIVTCDQKGSGPAIPLFSDLYGVDEDWKRTVDCGYRDCEYASRCIRLLYTVHVAAARAKSQSRRSGPTPLIGGHDATDELDSTF
jgi:hypothetical protein